MSRRTEPGWVWFESEAAWPLTCEPSYRNVPGLARTCDGSAIGSALCDRSAPSEVGLLDRRFASRHIQDPTDRLRVLYRLIPNQKLSATG